jgi:hypothetical protein
MGKSSVSVGTFIKGTLGGVIVGVLAASDNPFEPKPLPVSTVTVENAFGEPIDLSAKEAARFFENAAKNGKTPKAYAVTVEINGETKEFRAPKGRNF